MKAWLIGLMVIALHIPVAANATTVSEFLARDAELGAKGITDPTSPAFDSQNALISAAIANFRSANAAGTTGDKAAQTCLPPPGKGRLDAADIIAWFAAMAKTDATMSVDDAVAALLRARYPCKH